VEVVCLCMYVEVYTCLCDIQELHVFLFFFGILNFSMMTGRRPSTCQPIWHEFFSLVIAYILAYHVCV
ncbi:hypothetical protein ACJX0J_018707, partial [Zea mays]